jgi:uncharacterized membrane protein HdeD (DUF308 family)
VGVVLSLVGLVWIGQGVGVIGRSAMSGHAQYAVLGAVVLVAGLILVGWSYRTRKRRIR